MRVKLVVVKILIANVEEVNQVTEKSIRKSIANLRRGLDIGVENGHVLGQGHLIQKSELLSSKRSEKGFYLL